MENSGRVIDLKKDAETRKKYIKAAIRFGEIFEMDRDERERERAKARREAMLWNPAFYIETCKPCKVCFPYL